MKPRLLLDWVFGVRALGLRAWGSIFKRAVRILDFFWGVLSAFPTPLSVDGFACICLRVPEGSLPMVL